MVNLLNILAETLFFFILNLMIFPYIYNKSINETSDNEGKYPQFIKKLKNNEFKKIVFLVGDGISTSAGIPDFLSENGIFNQN